MRIWLIGILFLNFSAALAQLPRASQNTSSGDLGFFPTRVLTPEQRKELDLVEMLNHDLRGRILKVLEEEKRDWNRVDSLAAWERFRDPRIKALVSSLGDVKSSCQLKIHVTSEFRGDGYKRQNLVYQSRPGLWVTANLYLPAEQHAKMPGIVIVHSHHAPKTHFELQDMGIIWGRAGCVVLVMDQIGFGERMEIYPWDREAHNSSHILGMQLQLAGENLMGWIVGDILRGVDLLLERGDVDKNQIILLGAVAGGGDPAAVEAAIDLRIAAVAPFNFGEAEPEELRSDPHKNQWPLDLADPGWGDMVSTGALRGAIRDKFFPWTICAAVAPRRFIYSYELGWHVEDLPAWLRYQRVFGFYNALDHLADAHGFGPFPGPGECWNIGPAQRRSLYPTLERWFGIPLPFADAENSVDENLARRPTVNRRPVSELAVLRPSISAELGIRSIHRLAHEKGEREVRTARNELSKLAPAQRQRWLRARWSGLLGDIEPNPRAEAIVHWKKEIPGGEVEAITLGVEPEIIVPLLLLRPSTHAGMQVPVVVGVSQGGKDLFLSQRSKEIQEMLQAGIAVCLPDVRGTGETTPDPRLDPDGDEIREHTAASELMLGDTLLGKRLKDFRTVLVYLQSRHDLDSHRLGLWGESFAPPNPAHFVLDEQVQWQVGPEIQHQAEPLGGLLAVLGALYEDSVRTVAIRGGLASYLSALDDSFVYIPADVVVPGILQFGDIADVEAALAPRRVLLESLVDGRDRLLPDSDLHSVLASLYEAYRSLPPAALSVRGGEANTDLARWFVRSW